MTGSPNPPPPGYFMLRVRRDGPLVPARIWLCDHDPDFPDNKLDRGRLSVYPRAEIAGREVDPDRLFDRLMGRADWRPAHPTSHWKYAEPITAGEYQYRVAHLEWTRAHRPADPRGYASDPVKPAELPLGDFSREKALAG